MMARSVTSAAAITTHATTSMLRLQATMSASVVKIASVTVAAAALSSENLVVASHSNGYAITVKAKPDRMALSERLAPALRSAATSQTAA
jgi:hypothetical protein